jgi:hypothetical protein
MATTPEGKVKKLIKAVLDARKPALWYFMPVPGALGGKTLDFIGLYYGMFFTIEAKRPGERPTDYQGDLISTLNAAYGANFVVDDTIDYPISEVIHWLTWVEHHHPPYPGPYYEPKHLHLLELTGR